MLADTPLARRLARVSIAVTSGISGSLKLQIGETTYRSHRDLRWRQCKHARETRLPV